MISLKNIVRDIQTAFKADSNKYNMKEQINER